MMKFLSDPTGDLPWEEEPGSEDVTHLNNNNNNISLFV